MLTLRRRLVVVNLIVFLVTLAVLVSVISNQILSHLYEQIDEQLATSAAHTASRLIVANGHLHINSGETGPFGDPEGRGFVRLLDSQGTVVEGTGSYGSAPVRPASLNVGEHGGVANERNADYMPLRVYTLPVYAPFVPNGPGHDRAAVGYIQVAMAPEEVLEIASQIRQSLLVGIPLALLFAGIAGLLAARRALRPLVIMTRSAADISADSLTERRLPVPRPKDELQALALAFNATLERLSAAFARQRRFTADASHELRTPVTAILGQAELALSRPRTPAAYQETLWRIQIEAERMQRMIGRLLMLARAESGQQVLAFSPTDISALLHTLIESVAPNIEATEVRLELRSPDSVIVTTDADSLTQVLLNLLENAIGHTEQGVIEVSLTERSDHIVIQVSDEGPGIDPKDLPSIFEPFYRADPSRQSKKGSVGLGLALAHELTYLLGGRIEVANRPTGGAVFTVILPVQPPASS